MNEGEDNREAESGGQGQGQTNTTTEMETLEEEQSNVEDYKEEKLNSASPYTMCGHLTDKKERIKCKLVACFMDNQYCY